LTYALLYAPAGMTISSRGVISWTPGQDQSPSTNIVSVVATSTGNSDVINSALSATNSFLVVVTGTDANPALSAFGPVITAATLRDDGQFQFTFNSTDGAVYTVQYSTNLIDWNFVQALNGSGAPLTVTDPDAVGSSPRYYRVKVGAP
jgi:hypothetical protein